MNLNSDHSDKTSEHTTSTVDEYQSPGIASPTPTSSDITNNTSDQDENHSICEYEDTQESQEDVHRPDNAPPQFGDVVRPRGRPNPPVEPGRIPQSPEHSNDQEIIASRGANPVVAQVHPPAGPDPNIGNMLLPIRPSAETVPPALPDNH
ncbi:hypothetical protein FRC12_002626 [Ceratobasidium sp. 428]|nr:hypothetical protein FRC12_002626 [Ceratobasidium sp. 428]